MSRKYLYKHRQGKTLFRKKAMAMGRVLKSQKSLIISKSNRKSLFKKGTQKYAKISTSFKGKVGKNVNDQ